jgi:hypothetical protein
MRVGYRFALPLPATLSQLKRFVLPRSLGVRPHGKTRADDYADALMRGVHGRGRC